jgi:transcriptional repressor of dcmA and dcmR
MAAEHEDLLDIGQAAHFLNVSETSVRRWTNAGRLACVRIGPKRERRFRHADLQAFLEEQPAESTPGAARRESRQLGHTVIAGIPVPYGTHLCGLYSTDMSGAAQAVNFLADGFGPSRVCYLVATPVARHHIISVLERSRPSLQADIDMGRLVLVEYAASPRAQEDYFEATFAAATRAGARSLRVVGVMSWILEVGMAPDELVDFEASYDHRFRHRFPLVSLCQYDVRRFPSLSLLNALKGHVDSVRYPAERWLS